jgi:hypothetical protein
VPEICRFLGIVIFMYYSDHEPPHFHARYGGFKATIAITDGRLLVGQLPARVRGLVEEWRSTYREELLEDWDRARQGLPLVRIAPLA